LTYKSFIVIPLTLDVSSVMQRERLLVTLVLLQQFSMSISFFDGFFWVFHKCSASC
jgi:hypothetical protein